MSSFVSFLFFYFLITLSPLFIFSWSDSMLALIHQWRRGSKKLRRLQKMRNLTKNLDNFTFISRRKEREERERERERKKDWDLKWYRGFTGRQSKTEKPLERLGLFLFDPISCTNAAQPFSTIDNSLSNGELNIRKRVLNQAFCVTYSTDGQRLWGRCPCGRLRNPRSAVHIPPSTNLETKVDNWEKGRKYRSKPNLLGFISSCFTSKKGIP